MRSAVEDPESTLGLDEPDLFTPLRESEAIELCQALAAKHNGDPAKIEGEFRQSGLYDPQTAQATIQAGIDRWFNR